MSFYQIVNNELLISHDILKRMPIEDFVNATKIIANDLIPQYGEPIYVDDVSKMFTRSRLLEAFKSGDEKTARIISSRLGTGLTDEHFNARKIYDDAIDKINNTVITIGKYSFVVQPQEHDYSARFGFSEKHITVKGVSSSRYNNDYRITIERFKTIFANVIDCWMGVEDAVDVIPNQSFGNHGSKTIHINKNHVEIGCQRFMRHEVEYLGHQLGLKFEPSK